MGDSHSKRLPLPARLFVAAMATAGVAVISSTFWSWAPALPLQFLLYLGIAIASSGMKVSIPGISGNISVSYVFTLLCFLEFKVPETLFLALVATLSQSFWKPKEPVRPVHVIFNLSCISVSVGSAAFMYQQPWLMGSSAGEALRLTIAGVVYFLVNTLSVSAIIALSEDGAVHRVWRGFFNWSFAYYLVGVSIALMVHLSIQQLGWTFTVAVLPLLYAIYRSYHVYTGKMEQEKHHAENMASLHLRTIEALAMAIEAKDECTHEHLKRVQVYSLKTAEHLGLPPEQMRALEAAAILHDIGKLAVPDHIISKPGKLTPEEFDRMKIHTVVGAAILEQVAFPYPVTPIVRSHHERWDGSGYPDGLKGEDIPIGARILSAVDCLDALASDRQYRRALPLDEAMDYVASLAGRSFDMRVVEVLQKHYREFERLARTIPTQESRLERELRELMMTRGQAPAAGFQQDQPAGGGALSDEPQKVTSSIAAARYEVQAVLEAAHDASSALRLEEVLSVVAERLRHFVPFDCMAVYIREGNVLKPRYVNGESSRAFASRDIELGEGVSGWVAENKKPMVNGNPSVEPGYMADPNTAGVLKSALSVPLAGVEQLSGALTLYRAERDAFTRHHVRVLQAVVGKISRAIESAVRAQRAQRPASTDELTALPNARSLYVRLEEEIGAAGETRREFSVMLCDLDGFKYVNEKFGEMAGNELLRRVAAILRDQCRDTDYVARTGGDEFVVLLAGSRGDALQAKIESLNRAIRRAARDVCGEDKVGLSVGVACYPEHGDDSETLLCRAEDELYRAKRARRIGGPLQFPGNIVQVA